ncbi:hypothetical protein HHK36_015933 [Tetracentron sinense]|uniref:DUF3444 domain-containing protein n=1 Tax=Tetracentron sinense TaxID=13715 RepID=A0A834Z819_TETSI|nr:hypothetical protein HHK36_015933 [Tetracentron sinense]
MVEVVSEYTEESGVTVAGIIRVEGFQTVYQRFGLFKQFSRRELLRFSHRVPAVRLSGYEKNGVPTGSWKLNSAAYTLISDFPPNLEVGFQRNLPFLWKNTQEGSIIVIVVAIVRSYEVFVLQFRLYNRHGFHEGTRSISIVEYSGSFRKAVLCLHSRPVSWLTATESFRDGIALLEWPEVAYDEFGMLWASHDEFGMPRRYIRIDHSSGPGALSACGAFTVYRKAESINLSAISPLLPLSVPLIGKCTYHIYPRKGDVWAITGEPNLKLTPLHLGSPRIQMLQIVQVFENYHVGIGTRVVYLVKVNGSYRSLFRRHVNEGVEVSFPIPMKEFGRFSHQVPSFRLAGDEIVSGCFELDPSALPLHVDNFKDNVGSKIDNEYLSMRFLDLKSYNRLVNYKYHTLWAVYDPQYRIPIKYAMVFHSKSSESVVGMSWLEPDPTTEDQKSWYRAGLPIACGKFRSRETIDAQKDLVLSHPVPLKLLGNPWPGKYDCIIYPRTGDVWGIYKDWDMKWSCDSRFKNLFRRKAKSTGVVISFEIPKNDIYRFSHQIPAYRIRRKGDEEILEGSVVLDPQLMSHYVTNSYSFGQSSLSECLTNEERSWEIQPPHLDNPRGHVEEEKNGIELENQVKTHNRFEFSSTHLTEKMEKRKGTSEEVNLFPHEANLRKQGDERIRVEGDAIEQEMLPLEGETKNIFEQSNLECHDLDNFDYSKNYELDQIWALYDDLDGMPRSYARINRFIPTELKLEVTLLEPHAMIEEELQWVMEENLPMSCGTFRSSTSTIIKEMPLFSHQVVCGEGKTVRRSFYKIFPRKGEIWPIYRDWDPNWTHLDFKNHLHYRMVEVVSDYTEESGVTVAGIIRVEGFRTVYQRHLHDGFGLFKQFSRRELLLFSHRVPAVRLSGYEKNGVPTGSWELNSTVLVTHHPS